MMEGLQAKDFRPDESGFFSENLFKWLKKYPHYNRIYKATWNSFSGYDPTKPVLMIGAKEDCGNWFHGFSLRQVCIGRRMDATPFAYGISEKMHVHEWEDVTEQFIEEYKRIGVCAIHGDWAHRFECIGKTEKKCLNCGVFYKRKTKRVTKHYWEKEG